ncbi:MAG: hypothetical protein Q8P20_06270 [bacterium]|nr:hypothetical protein [bacterium]
MPTIERIDGRRESLSSTFNRGVSSIFYFFGTLISWILIFLVITNSKFPLVEIQQTDWIIPFIKFIRENQIILWILPPLCMISYGILLFTKNKVPRFRWTLISYFATIAISTLYLLAIAQK